MPTLPPPPATAPQGGSFPMPPNTLALDRRHYFISMGAPFLGAIIGPPVNWLPRENSGDPISDATLSDRSQNATLGLHLGVQVGSVFPALIAMRQAFSAGYGLYRSAATLLDYRDHMRRLAQATIISAVNGGAAGLMEGVSIVFTRQYDSPPTSGYTPISVAFDYNAYSGATNALVGAVLGTTLSLAAAAVGYLTSRSLTPPPASPTPPPQREPQAAHIAVTMANPLLLSRAPTPPSEAVLTHDNPTPPTTPSGRALTVTQPSDRSVFVPQKAI